MEIRERIIDAQTQNLVPHQQTTNSGKKRMKISIYTKRCVCVCVCVCVTRRAESEVEKEL